MSAWEKGKHWGKTFDESRKETVEGLLERYDSLDEIKDVVIDFGSGDKPVSRVLVDRILLLPEERRKRKILYVDFDSPKVARTHTEDTDILRVPFDINRMNTVSFTTGRPIEKCVVDFLGIDPSTTDTAHADTFVFSDIFNYLEDWKIVIRTLDKYLKPGGLVFIENVPNHGIRKYFSKKRPRSGLAVARFFERAMKYTREVPGRSYDRLNENSTWVYRKPRQTT